VHVNSATPIFLIFLFFFPNMFLNQFFLNIFHSSYAFGAGQSNREKLQHFKVDILQFPIPTDRSWPLYPLFDKDRNAIWVGDTVIDSGRIWEFDITNSTYKEHKLSNTSIVTASVLDANDTVWYLDPLLKRIGTYNPNSSFLNTVFNIQTNDTIFGMTIDNRGIIWMTSPNNAEVLRFDTSTKRFEPAIELPSSRPLGIAFDTKDNIWIADELGSIIRIPSNNQNAIYRYSAPPSSKLMLPSPTAILVDTGGNNIYVSNHNDQEVTSFNTTTGEFRNFKLPTLGLPFGMAMDKFGDIWIAQHTSNQSFVLDPSTGASLKFIVPHPNPYVQWITTDSNGNIWLAEQLAGSLGKIIFHENVTLQ
jgi:copper transport protein